MYIHSKIQLQLGWGRFIPWPHTPQKPIPTKLNLFIHLSKDIHGRLNVGPLWYKCILGGRYFSLLLDKCTLGQEYFDSENSRCKYNVLCFLKPLILYSNFRTWSFPIQLQQAHGKATPHECVDIPVLLKHLAFHHLLLQVETGKKSSFWVGKQGITNTLALPIDKLLYIYLLCPHSEHQNNGFQSKQSKHFHPRNQLIWCETGFNKIKPFKSWIQCDSLCPCGNRAQQTHHRSWVG
jgi:hypothetical protein